MWTHCTFVSPTGPSLWTPLPPFARRMAGEVLLSLSPSSTWIPGLCNYPAVSLSFPSSAVSPLPLPLYFTHTGLIKMSLFALFLLSLTPLPITFIHVNGGKAPHLPLSFNPLPISLIHFLPSSISQVPLDSHRAASVSYRVNYVAIYRKVQRMFRPSTRFTAREAKAEHTSH